MQRHWSQNCVQHHILGPFCREKSLSKITHIHPAKKKRKEDEKSLCAEGTVTAGSVYETRNCISKRIQEFSPLRKLLTRIHNKSSSVYMPLNWRARPEITLNSAGLCPSKKSSQPSELAIPEISITSPAFDPSPSCFHFLTLFPLFQLTYPFLPYHFSVLPSLSSPSLPLLLLLMSSYSFLLPIIFLSKRSKPGYNSSELLQWQKHSQRNSKWEKSSCICSFVLLLQLSITWQTWRLLQQRQFHLPLHDWKILGCSTSKLYGIIRRERKTKQNKKSPTTNGVKEKSLGAVDNKECHVWKSMSARNFLEDDLLKRCLVWTNYSLHLFILKDPGGKLKSHKNIFCTYQLQSLRHLSRRQANNRRYNDGVKERVNNRKRRSIQQSYAYLLLKIENLMWNIHSCFALTF